MRLILAIGLIALLAIPLMPTVEAKPYCTIGERDCRGQIVCVERPPVQRACVPDPCWTTHCWFAVRAEVPLTLS